MVAVAKDIMEYRIVRDNVINVRRDIENLMMFIEDNFDANTFRSKVLGSLHDAYDIMTLDNMLEPNEPVLFEEDNNGDDNE